MQDDTTVKRIYGTFPQIGHDNSMGLVRYYLALAVVVAHFNAIFGTELYFPTSSYNAVGGFFALSGFLVYPSYLKSKNLRVYFQTRPTYSTALFLYRTCLCVRFVCGEFVVCRRLFFQWTLAEIRDMQYRVSEFPRTDTARSI